jgi:hypothetical protein
LDGWAKFVKIYELNDIRREEEIYYRLHELMLKLLKTPQGKIYNIFYGNPDTG